MFFDKRIINNPRKLLFLFELSALVLLITYKRDKLDVHSFIMGFVFICIVYISNFILLKVTDGDQYIFLIATMLVSIGVLMIFRIDIFLGTRQLIWLSLGIFAFYTSYYLLMRFKNWDKHLYLYVLFSYGLFLFTFLLGERKHGAINWVEIWGVSIQPAEVIKILLIFILASYYSNENYISKKYSLAYLLLIGYSFIAILFLQKDLGMALIFLIIILSIQYIFEQKRKIVIYNILLSIGIGLMGYFLFDHVKIRFITWLNPWEFINDKGYQITQSLFALAEGGLFGRGLGLGHPYYIPLSYNDFIFSAICEEMGIFTGFGIILLFMILVYRGFKIGLNQANDFYKILALGISILLGTQVFIIIGGVTKLIPLTGITLPFVSYGGSSLLTSFISLGILQAISELNIGKD